MRVLADIAAYHPETEVEHPATMDRNKAAAIVGGLLQRPGASRLRATVAARAGRTLLAMLRTAWAAWLAGQ
jgi:hypothetical protein